MSTVGRLRGILGRRKAVVAAGALVAVVATSGALALTIKVHLFGSAPEALGTEPTDVETWTSPAFTIDRP